MVIFKRVDIYTCLMLYMDIAASALALTDPDSLSLTYKNINSDKWMISSM